MVSLSNPERGSRFNRRRWDTLKHRVQLRGSAIIITGGSGGIGSATARELVRRGARVVLAARRPEPLTRLATELGSSALACPTDVRDRVQIDRLVDFSLDRFGRLDGLVNAHGVSHGARVFSDPDADMQEIVETNLLALARTARAVVPTFRERGAGVIARVPTSSGLLEGDLTLDHEFTGNDHRRHRPRSWLVEGLQKVDPDLRYVGFRIPPVFVVGYGLDVDERYRNLPYVCEYAEPDA